MTSDRMRQIADLIELMGKAREDLGKKPGEVLYTSADCPACLGEETVTIWSDGKRMFRLKCSTPNCLEAMG